MASKTPYKVPGEKVKKYKEKLQSIEDDFGFMPDTDDLLWNCYDLVKNEEVEKCIKKLKKSSEYKQVLKLEKLMDKEKKLKRFEGKKVCSNGNWLENLKMSSSSGKPLDFSSQALSPAGEKCFMSMMVLFIIIVILEIFYSFIISIRKWDC